ncbi:MAG: molybdenum cofactor biosynthesis protein MoaE [Gammaproteobacteria bacterium]
MSMSVQDTPIDVDALRRAMTDVTCGAFTSFEGWIRNHNEGQDVLRLEYEVYEPLALKEGERLIAQAVERFGVTNARVVHREGLLELGDCAVWVGVSAPHRDEAFAACRFLIDETKVRLPIWKKEHYVDGHSGWVNCERCAAHAH